MESVHVVFDDKKIQGLLDEGFHDSLKFDDEGEGVVYDSDDEGKIQINNVMVNILRDMFSTENPTFVENSAEISVEASIGTSIEVPSHDSIPARSQGVSDLRGAFYNHNFASNDEATSSILWMKN